MTAKFWGAIIEPRSSFIFTSSQSLKLRNATIQTRNDTFAETVLVLGVPRTVSILQAPQNQQACFAVVLDAGIQYTLSALGPNSIAVLGMYSAESDRISSTGDLVNIPVSMEGRVYANIPHNARLVRQALDDPAVQRVARYVDNGLHRCLSNFPNLMLETLGSWFGAAAAV
ncbi:hypothetical protein FB446DRAFT_704241 [Lentinula raphanica]|nr:hypothetical protein FB446DRAFT_704241 [Lentinula raphanica]